jgi:hypothetical protein
VELAPDGNETAGNVLPNCPIGIEVVISFRRKIKMRRPWAAAHLQQALAAEGISAEEILKDFKRWHRGQRK